MGIFTDMNMTLGSIIWAVYKPSKAAEYFGVLGACHADGAYGASKSDRLAKAWFKIASRLGSADAENALGYMAMQGRGEDPSLPKAVEHFSKAIVGGSADAAYNMAVLCLNCSDMPDRKKLAYAFAGMAAESGYKPAKRLVARLRGFE